MEEYLVPVELPIAKLECRDSFNSLEDKDKHYAYNFYKSCWSGIGIIAAQVSEESKDLLKLVRLMFTDSSNFNLLKDESDEIKTNFLNYWGYLCANLGNYTSWGEKKFIPRISKEDMKRVISKFNDDVQKNYDKLEHTIYSIEDNEKILGFPPENTSAYFSKNLTEKEIKTVTRFMESIGMEGWNTRLIKLDEEDEVVYVILLASIEPKPEMNVNKVHEFEGFNIIVTCGDHSDELKDVVKHLEKAKEYANDIQSKMIDSYVKHFTNGDIEDHKESQRYWIQDKSPNVETNIGFIENYRDPEGVRAEFEGLVAVVNKEQSKKYKVLVDNAETYIEELPWDKLFEKEKFTPPDYTSLDVLGFCTSGPPIGINIPNYDDIRTKLGFKNVTLGNVISCLNESYGGKPQFIPEKDHEMYKKYVSVGLDIGVAAHELLGHGSGTLLYEGECDEEKFKEFLKNNPEFKYSLYKKGETWSSKFKSLASTYEECRAESCALYFACNKDIAKVFGVKDEEYHDVLYTNWLNMMVSAVKGTSNYSTEKGKWMQAHSQGRFVIMKVLKENNFVKLKFTDDNMEILMDKDKILTEGKKIIGDFINRLQVYKATGNFEDGNKFYQKYSTLDEEDMKMLEVYRKHKKPRSVIVQPSLKLENNSFEYIEYNKTSEGLIRSFIDKFDTNYDI